jgi:predicted DNA binding CopG/RHH family protein|tara:strand:+ start:2192 stop:2356 length:165 start_codon:yes stop_codon:yes gene_type:complete
MKLRDKDKTISLRLNEELLLRVREKLKGKETLSAHIRQLLAKEHPHKHSHLRLV